MEGGKKSPEAYAKKRGIRFRMGKSGVLPVGGSPQAGLDEVVVLGGAWLPVTRSYMCFGVLRYVHGTAHEGRHSKDDEFLWMRTRWVFNGQSFPLPLLCPMVVARGGERGIAWFGPCIHAPRAEQRLNVMQARWARSPLVCHQGARHGMRALAVAMCGWECRLGSKMTEPAVMLLARVEFCDA